MKKINLKKTHKREGKAASQKEEREEEERTRTNEIKSIGNDQWNKVRQERIKERRRKQEVEEKGRQDTEGEMRKKKTAAISLMCLQDMKILNYNSRPPTAATCVLVPHRDN